MTPQGHEQPERPEPSLELDERIECVETERIEPILPEAAPLPAVPRRYPPMTLRQRLAVGVLLTLGFGGVIAMIVWLQLKLDPDAMITRGWAALEKKDWDAAVRYFTDTLEVRPTDNNAYYGRGQALEAKGEYEKAIADYTEAIRLYQRDAHAYVRRGWCYARKKDYNLAIADESAAIRIDPKRAGGYGIRSGYNTLAWLLATCPEQKFRDGTKAVELATKVCELTSWKDPGCLDTLAAAYAETGQFADAVKWQKKSLEFPEDDKDELAKAQERLKLYEGGNPYRDE